MERWAAKIVALLAIFAVVFTATVLPIKVSRLFARHGERGRRYVSYLMCFGGGVFLSVYMLHMTPECRDIIEGALPKSYPLTELFIAAGLFAMIVCENIIQRAQSSAAAAKKRRTDESGNDDDEDVTMDRVGRPAGDVVARDLLATRMMSCSKASLVVVNAGYTLVDGVVVPPTSSAAMTSSSDAHRRSDNVQLSVEELRLLQKHQRQQLDNEKKIEASGSGAETATPLHAESATRSLVLLFALCLDHIFEGVSIGLKTSSSSVFNLAFAIVAHEVVIAFSLGMEMVKSYGNTRKVLLAATMCSGMVPIGILVGMAIMETGGGGGGEGGGGGGAVMIVNGVLQCLATGVFIYVTFFEILGRELEHGHAAPEKIFFMLFGFAILALMALIPTAGDPTLEDLANNSTVLK